MVKIIIFFAFILCSCTKFQDITKPVKQEEKVFDKVILIDFDGHNVVETGWNQGKGIDTIKCTPSSLTESQRLAALDTVAKAYSLYNVLVTTDETKYNSANIKSRTRVIVTNYSKWYGNAGGAAYTGSFTWGENLPAFVFSGLIGNNVKRISYAIAHEAGHTIGLRHEVSTTGLKPGPIMGNPYNEPNPYWTEANKTLLTNVLGLK